jgi:hypothetical protein
MTTAAKYASHRNKQANNTHYILLKPFPPLTAVFAASLFLAHGEQQPALLTDPPDGSEASEPEARAEFAPAEILETTVIHEGGRDVIVQHLALDPNDPIIPVFPTTPTDSAEPAVPADTAGSTEPNEPTEDVTTVIPDETPSYLPTINATVYPGPRTFLSWTHISADGTSREFSGWSNIDFNHLDSIYDIIGTDGNQHTFIMGVGTESESDEENQPPPFATEAPTFVPDGEIPAEALVVVDSLHKIYATEGEMLAEAYAEREAARLAEKAEAEEELANPPPPKDLIIRYRIAETPLPTPAEGGAE